MCQSFQVPGTLCCHIPSVVLVTWGRRAADPPSDTSQNVSDSLTLDRDLGATQLLHLISQPVYPLTSAQEGGSGQEHRHHTHRTFSKYRVIIAPGFVISYCRSLTAPDV